MYLLASQCHRKLQKAANHFFKNTYVVSVAAHYLKIDHFTFSILVSAISSQNRLSLHGTRYDSEPEETNRTKRRRVDKRKIIQHKHETKMETPIKKTSTKSIKL